MKEFVVMGELTRVCWMELEAFCESKWLSEDEGALRDDTSYAMELDKKNFVLEGIQKHLGRLGVNILPDDIKGIKKEIKHRYEKIGITDDNRLKSVRDWIDGKSEPSPTNRENLYNLCLALELDVEMTMEFFLKNYLAIPFNFKDCVDVAYYYGILRGKTYKEITDILERVKKEKSTRPFENKDTLEIKLDVSEIEEDEKLIQYVVEYTCGREQQFYTAKKNILELVRKNAQLATKERKEKLYLKRNKISMEGEVLSELAIYNPDNEEVNYKQLLSVVYGFDMQENYAQKAKEKKEIITTDKKVMTFGKCDKLPEKLRKNFPKDEEFAEIKKGKATAETYRKALILMNFYNYFCTLLIRFFDSGKDIYDYREVGIKPVQKKSRLEDFYYETNALLAKCGFVQMYARNPFDWVILYCASTEDPLDTFRKYLGIQYLNDGKTEEELEDEQMY